MSFTSLRRNVRPLTDLFDPMLFASSFRGGPSAKTTIPSAIGSVQPIHSFSSEHHPSAPGLTPRARDEQWKLERLVAVTMLAIIPGSFVFDSLLMNYLFAFTLTLHAHWGMDAVLTSYCPKKALPMANFIRYFLSTIAFLGLCYLNYRDVGVTKALKTLWAISST